MTHNLTPLQRLAVEAIQEDERLTTGLDDERAAALLRWATAQAADLTRTAADEAAAEAVAQAVRQAVRMAARADGTIATAERALAGLLPTNPSHRAAPPSSPPTLGSGIDQPTSLPSAQPSTHAYRRRWLETLPLTLLSHIKR